MSAQRTVSREVQARIVEDLARGHRPVSAIADRHHVPADLVVKLREAFGPGPVELSEAAKRLRKPEPPVAPPAAPAEIAALVAEVCPPAKDPKPYRDGLTGDERAKCRAWAESRGLLDPARHSGVMLRRAVVESWRAEDCPDVSARTLESAPDDFGATPDDVIDAPIVCGTCGAPLPDPWGDSCPSCGTLFAPAVAGAAPEQVKTTGNPAPWHDWSALMERAEGVPAVVREWDMAIQHVEMLRDALAEHEHREDMAQRVQDAIKLQGLYLTLSQVRLVLDAIEAS